MYEVKYSINGIIKTIMLDTNDYNTIFNVLTNMFQNEPINIIDISRR